MEDPIERFESRIKKSENCWEWNGGKSVLGYGRFWLDGRDQRAHRVSYQFYVGEIPDGLNVCHRCDNPGCVNPDHLFLGTTTDNARDRMNKGRGFRPTGERHHMAKLTEEKVKEIRARHSDGARGDDLAKEFCVSEPTISMIVCGHIWANV